MTELAAAGNSWRGPAVPDGIDALMHNEQLGEDAALEKSGPAGLATPVRRRDARRESLACRPKQPAERTGVQVTGRLGEAKRRSASSGGDRAPDAVLSSLARCLCAAQGLQNERSSRSVDHPPSPCEGVSCSNVDRYASTQASVYSRKREEKK